MAVLLAGIALANSHLPPGLLKIIEANNAEAVEFLRNISFFIAFLAGITTIFSPCILPIIPAFFAYTFKEKKRITKMTLLFFLGFTPVFISLGILATYLGDSLVPFFERIVALTIAAGIIFILLGLFVISGKGFFFLRSKNFGTRNDSIGILLSGALFSFGWIVCIGPILSGILLMGSVLHNYLTATYLMLAYSIGLFTPLFLFSVFFDKFKIATVNALNKRFIVAGREFVLSNIIAGSMFIMIGILFLFFKGTAVVNGFNMFGLRENFYSLQDMFLERRLISNSIGIAVFLMLASLVYAALRKRRERLE
ncbi:cytochrome c biogenesis protein CcdA [Candidatus Woesearchaeota archaeon]|nr:cytochrome c biogenesis protein CcdA [Candidatus Woesearchaeota archaeon]